MLNYKHYITTFYKFTKIENTAELKLQLQRFCLNNKILGTIIIAEEGINGTVYGVGDSIKFFEDFMYSMAEFTDIEFKRMETRILAFDRLKIKIKPEIVTLKCQVDAINNSGAYLNSNEWNNMLDMENSIVIDTRNSYECEIGTFKGAINPNTENFSDLPKWLDSNLTEQDKQKNILMCCTGGVRCEKSTAYLKERGFKHVYHLQGGIIKYLQDSKKSANYWEGPCFVFDNRISIEG